MTSRAPPGSPLLTLELQIKPSGAANMLQNDTVSGFFELPGAIDCRRKSLFIKELHPILA
jgi:hypothetical protein